VDIIIDFPIDPGDAKFLACAIVANADFLITGDSDLSAGKKLVDSAIVTVTSFKAWFYDAE
jgi:predicted nucleic acid-binding protein